MFSTATPDPKIGDICTVVKEYDFAGIPIYVLEEFPRPGGYDARGFAPLNGPDERDRLEAWQSDRLTREDKMLQALAENMPVEEMSEATTARLWEGIETHLKK